MSVLVQIERFREEWRDQGRGGFIVSLIGMASSGKTFFLERLKHNLHGEVQRLDPPLTPAGEEVPATLGDLQPHLLLGYKEGDAPDGQDRRNFLIIDIPGEDVARAFDFFRRSQKLGGTDLDLSVFSSSIAHSDAVCFMWPLSSICSTDDPEAEKTQSLFNDILTWMAFIGQQKRNEIGGFDFDNIDSAAFLAAFNDFAATGDRRYEKPFALCMSKADEVMRDSKMAKLDAVDILADRRPSIITALRSRTENFLPAYVAAFIGQADRHINYGHPHIGVDRVFEWLLRNLDRTQPSGKWGQAPMFKQKLTERLNYDRTLRKKLRIG